jgi:hypothetical protein
LSATIIAVCFKRASREDMFCFLLLRTAASLELAVSSTVEKEQSKHCSIDASNSTHKLEPTMIDCSGDMNAGPEQRQNQG